MSSPKMTQGSWPICQRAQYFLTTSQKICFSPSSGSSKLRRPIRMQGVYTLAPINDTVVFVPEAQVRVACYNNIIIMILLLILLVCVQIWLGLQNSSQFRVTVIANTQNYVTACMGFSSKMDEMLIKAAKVDTCPERKKCVLLLLDEMHICEDLVCSTNTMVL